MNETFGDRIRRLREERKLKQDQVAKMLCINRKAISHYENNLREPSFEMLVKMAELYHVSTDYLLGIEKQYVVDVSQLSTREDSLIRELVKDLTDKNQLLKNMQTEIADEGREDKRDNGN